MIGGSSPDARNVVAPRDEAAIMSVTRIDSIIKPMPNDRPHIFGLTADELRRLIQSWGMPPYRAGQLLDWVYRKNIADPHAMTNLATTDRDFLAGNLRCLTGGVVHHQRAGDGTQKMLIDWAMDHENAEESSSNVALPLAPPSTAAGSDQTECVMIPTDGRGDVRPRRTACISSQVGCAVGCRFCASGLGGVDRDLSAGQIVEQVWRLQQLPGVGRITNVVFMGMGEPLANFAAVTRAVKILMADWGMAISGRRITISTVGLPAQMRRLADLRMPVTLAISLHAPDDALRRELIPWADYVRIEQLIDAARYYFEKTGREVTLEYILLRDVNDQPHHARQLTAVAEKLRGHINLIRYNPVKGLTYQRPRTEDVIIFQNVLREANINVHIRASRGRDIAAACGQLRHETRTASA